MTGKNSNNHRQQVRMQDWEKSDYLYRMVNGAWKPAILEYLQIKSAYPTPHTPQQKATNTKFGKYLLDLASKIEASKRYNLIWEYRQYLAKIEPPDMSEISEEDAEIFSSFFLAHIALYAMICNRKGRILAGIVDYPLWIDFPLRQDQKMFESGEVWLELAPTLLWIAQFLSGDNKQQAYDRLLLPQPGRWPIHKTWTKTTFEKFLTDITHGLGFSGEGERKKKYVTQEEFETILAQAIVNRRYTLVKNRPVLVRLINDPQVNEVFLMEKDNCIIAKIVTHENGDILTMLSLNDPEETESSLFLLPMEADNHKKILSGVDKTYLEYINHRKELYYTVPALIAAIYRDLVTAKVVEGVRQADESGKKETGKKNKQLKKVRKNGLIKNQSRMQLARSMTTTKKQR